MKQGYFLCFLSLLFFSCHSSKMTTTSDQYLPSFVDNVKLGMTRDQTLAIRKNAVEVNSFQETPRVIFTEDVDTEDMTSVYFFFLKQAPETLVEINILHKSKEAALKTINQFFGEKHTKQNQWHKKLSDGTLIHATCRKQKVFIYIEHQKEIINPAE